MSSHGTFDQMYIWSERPHWLVHCSCVRLILCWFYLTSSIMYSWRLISARTPTYSIHSIFINIIFPSQKAKNLTSTSHRRCMDTVNCPRPICVCVVCVRNVRAWEALSLCSRSARIHFPIFRLPLGPAHSNIHPMANLYNMTVTFF